MITAIIHNYGVGSRSTTSYPYQGNGWQHRSIEAYLHKLRRSEREEKTEHTDRSALEGPLQDFAAKGSSVRSCGKIVVRHEPKRDRDFGAPDFLIFGTEGILGYVEVKSIGTSLHKLAKSEQIKKYRNLSQNILLTDYISWLWLGDGNDAKSPTALCTPAQLDDKKFRPSSAALDEAARQLEGFFSVAPKGVGRASELAAALAARCRHLGKMLIDTWRRQREGRLLGLYEGFQKQISKQLELDEFADAYAQMLGYGLLFAHLQTYRNGSEKTGNLTLRNAERSIQDSFGLLKEMMGFLPDLEKEHKDVRWIVDEILSIVNHMDVAQVRKDLSFLNRKAAHGDRDEKESELFLRDPFVYFYKDFLASYDKKSRKQRGVYYTPPPVVRFIVRSTDWLLRGRFGIHDGLACSKLVTALDFALAQGHFCWKFSSRFLKMSEELIVSKRFWFSASIFLKTFMGSSICLRPTLSHI